MPQATFWFSSPFKEWIGQRSLALSWEGVLTVRGLWERLAGDYPRIRQQLPRGEIDEEAMSHMVAVIVEGDILTLDAVIKDRARVDVLTPLSGGCPSQPFLLPPRGPSGWKEKGSMRGSGRPGMSNCEP